MHNDDIVVSVCCLAYNHKKYIKKTLDSILEQETKFNYEIIINDDCSTDGTTEIIKEYEEKYKEVIVPIYHSENVFQKEKSFLPIMFGMFEKCKGKYIVLCECDDYWCDTIKLQKQVEQLENNLECSVSVHKVKCIDESGNAIDKIFPPIDVSDTIINSKNYIHWEIGEDLWMFQTSSYMFRAEYMKEYMNDTPQFAKESMVGDQPLMMFLVEKGKILYIPEIMSCYRVESVTSVTKENAASKERKIKRIETQKETFVKYNEYSQFKYQKDIEKRICELEFQLYSITENYRQIVKGKYRYRLRKLGKKFQIYCLIMAYFPGVRKLVKFYVRNKHKT